MLVKGPSQRRGRDLPRDRELLAGIMDLAAAARERLQAKGLAAGLADQLVMGSAMEAAALLSLPVGAEADEIAFAFFQSIQDFRALRRGLS